jgi:hypothetical protein
MRRCKEPYVNSDGEECWDQGSDVEQSRWGDEADKTDDFYWGRMYHMPYDPLADDVFKLSMQNGREGTKFHWELPLHAPGSAQLQEPSSSSGAVFQCTG